MRTRLETPERNRLAAIDDRAIDEIETKITFLTEELSELKKQIQQEKKRLKRRTLNERAERISMELRWLRYQEERITKSIIERR